MCNEAVENTAGKGGSFPGPTVATRQSAKGVLEDRIRRAEEHLGSLFAIRDSIPWNALCPEVEKSLWLYFSRGR